MAPIIVYVGGSREARQEAVRRQPDTRDIRHIDQLPAWRWPFQRHLVPREPAIVRVGDLHEAFPAAQTPGTRFVLTQSTYQLQRWLDWLRKHPGTALVAEADQGALARAAPEAAARRGPWAHVDFVALDGPAPGAESARVDIAGDDVSHAFQQPDAERRLEICERAAAAEPANAALLLAWASACMELQQLDDAQPAIERALELAPEWEAAHFEYGKQWLRRDNTERAAAAFAEAGRLMPGFSAAFSNLGAALGELDRHEEALAALQQALRYDPRGYPILNNIGVVSREVGRLEEAAQAFSQVVTLAPGYVFGHYNLGHTRFLQGRFAEALAAYEEGRSRDPQQNARQACRMGLARAAMGDVEGARRELLGTLDRTPREMWPDLVEEVENALSALSALPDVNAAAMKELRDGIHRYST